MKISTIQKASTPELVVRELLQNIKQGSLKPGDKLPPERELAQAFGVSRSSVREAISAMVLVGYMEVTQGKGIFVKDDIPSPYVLSSTLRDVLDAYWTLDVIETRQIMECSLVKLAVMRAGKNDIAKLRQTLHRMEENIDNLEGFYKADFEFHNAICEATNNEIMSEMLKIIIAKTHAHYMKFMPDALCKPNEAVSTARKIVDCIEEGKAEQASQAMIEHLNLVSSELVRLIPEAERYRDQIDTIFYALPSDDQQLEQSS
jgi:GntR family transcriptional repressor for pyruvate dehydrogenase complex